MSKGRKMVTVSVELWTGKTVTKRFSVEVREGMRLYNPKMCDWIKSLTERRGNMFNVAFDGEKGFYQYSL